MQVKDLFQDLSYGELSSHAVVNDTTGTITSTKIPKMLALTNAALLELHTKFDLRVESLLLQSYDNISTYYLRPEYALSNPTVGRKYILDSNRNPFVGNIIKILGITNERGDPLPMNDAEQWASVFTPMFDTVELTHPGSCQIFEVCYTTTHNQLELIRDTEVTDYEATLDQEIYLPPVLHEALRLLVAKKIFSGMSGQDSTSKTQELTATLQSMFMDIQTKNLLLDSVTSTNIKFTRRGFI